MGASSWWNPLGRLTRASGPRARRARPTPVPALVVVAAVLVGAAACGSSSPSSSPSTSPATTGGSSTSSPSPVSSASTSTRGITAGTINVVFPVVSLNSLAGQEGFASDPEYAEQDKAINFYVKQVNDSGGISGRKINAIITSFDPTNETQMRALCKSWTEGSPAAFAVLDGIGDWTGDDQLCITQEGHTPFIGAWSTVTNWTNEGSPYLWWTGPDQATILQAVVNWGLSAHL
ncbi:MAG: ABC transporter substrate-binding protein, partial [Acidimicrobiales bacterium]